MTQQWTAFQFVRLELHKQVPSEATEWRLVQHAASEECTNISKLCSSLSTMTIFAALVTNIINITAVSMRVGPYASAKSSAWKRPHEAVLFITSVYLNGILLNEGHPSVLAKRLTHPAAFVPSIWWTASRGGHYRDVTFRIFGGILICIEIQKMQKGCKQTGVRVLYSKMKRLSALPNLLLFHLSPPMLRAYYKITSFSPEGWPRSLIEQRLQNIFQSRSL